MRLHEWKCFSSWEKKCYGGAMYGYYYFYKAISEAWTWISARLLQQEQCLSPYKRPGSVPHRAQKMGTGWSSFPQSISSITLASALLGLPSGEILLPSAAIPTFLFSMQGPPPLTLSPRSPTQRQLLLHWACTDLRWHNDQLNQLSATHLYRCTEKINRAFIIMQVQQLLLCEVFNVPTDWIKAQAMKRDCKLYFL